MANVSAENPFVLQFGAGAIGRGFLGQLWTGGGYGVVFVDIDPDLIAALNAGRAYPLRLVENDHQQELTIGPVRAISATDPQAVADALASCDFACTAVGVNVFERLAPTLSQGIGARQQEENKMPLNIICCENQKDAGAHLHDALAEQNVPDDTLSGIGFVDAVVGRMVPPPTQTARGDDDDPLLVVAEPYATLPVNGATWVGTQPVIPGVSFCTDFAAYVAQKLFVHNGGHACLAYHGFLAGHEFIWQAASDPAIVRELTGFWQEVNQAITRAFALDSAGLQAHADDLLRRFRNRALGDTLVRVGRDPLRKLRFDDRLVGAALLCEENNIEPVFVVRAIAAALRFAPPKSANDPSATQMRQALAEKSVAEALAEWTHLEPEHPLVRQIAAAGQDAEKNDVASL